MEIQEIKQIAAFLPCYEKGRGQGIKIYYRNGETGFLHLAMRTFLAKTAGLFAVSLRESRKRYGLLLDRKNLVPLVLTPYLLYVPLKARIPAVPGDPAYGYFRLRSIIEINREPQPCTLLLEGGHNLTINQSYCAPAVTCRRRGNWKICWLVSFCKSWIPAPAVRTAIYNSALPTKNAISLPIKKKA